MFDNIGAKIKGLAKTLTWLSVIGSIVLGIVYIAIISDSWYDELWWVGLVIMAVGSLFAWISYWLLYGYGQLIENSDKLVLAQKNDEAISKK